MVAGGGAGGGAQGALRERQWEWGVALNRCGGSVWDEEKGLGVEGVSDGHITVNVLNATEFTLKMAQTVNVMYILPQQTKEGTPGGDHGAERSPAGPGVNEDSRTA